MLAHLAAAAAFTLGLSGPSDGVVGQPMVVQASGTIPLQDLPYPYWLSVDAIPANVVPTCPAEASAGAQIAYAAGGQIVVLTQREVADQEGNFSAPVGFTPWAPGPVLLCAYTDDGATTTLARASLLVNVQGGGVKPANVKKPRVTRQRRRLACNPGEWSNATGYAYSWVVNGRKRKGGRTLAARHGWKVRCAVTASNGAGATTAVSRTVRVR